MKEQPWPRNQKNTRPLIYIYIYIYISGGSKGGARAPPLFLDQNETRRAENNFFGDRAPSLFQGLDDRSPTPPPPI